MTENKPKADDEPDPLTEINKLIHEPARLMIMANLYVVKSMDFIFLRNQTQLTWGNLSSHISKLENADYVDVQKSFKGKKPHTMLSLTEQGRTAFIHYRKKMKQVLDEIKD